MKDKGTQAQLHEMLHSYWMIIVDQNCSSNVHTTFLELSVRATQCESGLI